MWGRMADALLACWFAVLLLVGGSVPVTASEQCQFPNILHEISVSPETTDKNLPAIQPFGPFNLTLTINGMKTSDEIQWTAPPGRKSQVLGPQDIYLKQVTTRPSNACFRSWSVIVSSAQPSDTGTWTATIFQADDATATLNFTIAVRVNSLPDPTADHSLCKNLPGHRFKCLNGGSCVYKDAEQEWPLGPPCLGSLAFCHCRPGFVGDRCEFECKQTVTHPSDPSSKSTTVINVNKGCPLNFTAPGPGEKCTCPGPKPLKPGGSCPGLKPGQPLQLHLAAVDPTQAVDISCESNFFRVTVNHAPTYMYGLLKSRFGRPPPCKTKDPTAIMCNRITAAGHAISCPIAQGYPLGKYKWEIVDSAVGCYGLYDAKSRKNCPGSLAAFYTKPEAVGSSVGCGKALSTSGDQNLSTACELVGACYRCTLDNENISLSYDVLYEPPLSCPLQSTDVINFLDPPKSVMPNSKFLACDIITGGPASCKPGNPRSSSRIVKAKEGDVVNLTVGVKVREKSAVYIDWLRNGSYVLNQSIQQHFILDSSMCYTTLTLTLHASKETEGNYTVYFVNKLKPPFLLRNQVDLNETVRLDVYTPEDQVGVVLSAVQIIAIAVGTGLLFAVLALVVCSLRRMNRRTDCTLSPVPEPRGDEDDFSAPVTWRQLAHLAKFLSVDWRLFMADIGLQEYQIRACIGSYPASVMRQADEALRVWFEQVMEPGKWTVNLLIKQLQENELQSVADNWEQKLATMSSLVTRSRNPSTPRRSNPAAEPLLQELMYDTDGSCQGNSNFESSTEGGLSVDELANSPFDQIARQEAGAINC